MFKTSNNLDHKRIIVKIPELLGQLFANDRYHNQYGSKFSLCSNFDLRISSDYLRWTFVKNVENLTMYY